MWSQPSSLHACAPPISVLSSRGSPPRYRLLSSERRSAVQTEDMAALALNPDLSPVKGESGVAAFILLCLFPPDTDS